MPPLTLSDVRINLRMIAVNRVLSLPIVPRRLRPRLLRALRLRISSHSVGHGVWFEHRDVRLGPGVVVDDGAKFLGRGAVDVAAGAHIGRGAVIDTRENIGGDLRTWAAVMITENTVVPPGARVRAGRDASGESRSPVSESG